MLTINALFLYALYTSPRLRFGLKLEYFQCKKSNHSLNQVESLFCIIIPKERYNSDTNWMTTNLFFVDFNIKSILYYKYIWLDDSQSTHEKKMPLLNWWVDHMANFHIIQWNEARNIRPCSDTISTITQHSQWNES